MTGPVLGFLYQHYPALAGALVALLMILWPPPGRAEEEARRQERLAELRSGADEDYLEERRALEAYGPGSAGPYRLFGLLLLILSAALLFP